MTGQYRKGNSKMKTVAKLLIVFMAATMLLAGCGNSAPTEPAGPADLNGEWKQTNGSETNYQSATITDSTIEIYWVNEDSKSLYWAGTYVAPTDSAEPYTWDSENDTEKTGSALLASGDPTKTFTYEDGIISYEASALGTTKTIKLERQK